MSVKRHTLLMELLLMLCIAGISGWYGWHYVSAIDDTEMLRNTKMLPIPVLPGAIHFALGRGIGVAHEKEAGFPELEAFLTSKSASIPRTAWPEAGTHAKGGGHFLYMHYYLVAYLGSIFYLLGISVWSFRIACILMHVVSMLALYGIFRLMMGRLLSVALVSSLSSLHACLVMLPVLRDLAKAPFILVSLLYTGILVKDSVKPRRLYGGAILLGAVIGVGYGFRQDVFVCLPLALFCILAASRPVCAHPWRARLLAGLALSAMFTVCAMPVLKGNREVGGTITVHTLFQGVMRCAEDNARFYSDSYDYGYLNYDHPVTAQIRAYAKRTGDSYPLYDLTPAYGEVGGRMFREFMRAYPADLAGRVPAVLDSLAAIPAGSFQWMREHSETVSEGRLYGGQWLEPVQRAMGRFFDTCGLIILLAALGVLAAHSFRAAALMVVFLAYFSVYPSTLFEFRHYFYLAFVPFFFSGMLISLSYRNGAVLYWYAGAKGWKSALRKGLRAAAKGGLFVTGLVVCMVLLLSGLRVFQKRHWDRSLDQYAHASLAPLTLEEEREGDNVRLLLPQNMTALRGHTPPGPGEVASFYLVARFKGEGRTVSFQLLNTNPIFTRPCQVVLQGEGLYFFPVYDYDFNPPFTFLGIALSAGDRPFFEGLYLFENGDSMRLWPYVFVPEDRRTFAYYKMGRLDRGILGFQAQARGGFGLYPEKSQKAFLSLIPRHPFHDAFAGHALWCARRCGGEEHLIHTWETIGAFMPEWRSEAGQWLVARAEEAQQENNPGEAVRLYEKAGAILPENLRYRERTGELQERGGEFAAARTTYKSILQMYPENASVAYRLHALSAGEPGVAEYASFWEDLVDDFPQAAVPRLYYGMVLEERGDVRGALEAYAKVVGDTPVGAEAELRRGMLLTKEGAYEEGVALLHAVAVQHPELSGQVENVFLEVYLQLKEREEYGAAATMYEILSTLTPDRPDIHEKLAELYALIGESHKAIDLYERLLQQKPDQASPAKRLDALYAGTAVAPSFGEGDNMMDRAVTFWSTLAGTYPNIPIPYVYLGAALERRDETAAAQEAYRHAMEIAPGSAEALYRSGALEVLDGAVDTGLAKMREAVVADAGLAGDISRRCDQIAAVLVEQQQHEPALRLYQTALEVSPRDLWPRVHQGELYERMGDEQAAAGCYRDVLMAVPESPVTAKLLDRLLRQHPSGGKTVVEEWRVIVQRHPEAAIPAFYLGKALESAGDRSGAADYYGRAIQLNSALSEAAERLRSLETRPPDQ